MKIDSNQILSMSEANKNFSKVAKMAEANGGMLVLKNNVPKYIVLDINDINVELTNDAQIDIASKQVLRKYKKAYEALAK